MESKNLSGQGLLGRTMSEITSPNQKAMIDAQAHLDVLTKPQGSLGRLEQMIVQLAGITGDFQATFPSKRVVVMAADHGVVEEGVSAFPQDVTAQMVFNFLQGGAAINVLARQAGAEVVCVDVGVASDLSGADGLLHKKVAWGTQNFLRQPAMTQAQAIHAIEVGIEVARLQKENGVDLLATGEMGIGNTTASSAVLAALLASQSSVEQVVGKGTGVSVNVLEHKRKVVQTALQFHAPDPADPLDVLQKVGGFELCALAGLVIGAAAQRIPVVIDGFISTVAALCAVRLCPQTLPFLIASHLSEEPGHALALQELGIQPALHLNMRLGEGTGAALLFPVIDASQRIMREMATFGEAGVSGSSQNE